MTQNKHSINVSFIFFPTEVQQLENQKSEAQKSRSLSKIGALSTKADSISFTTRVMKGPVCLA